MNIIIKSIKDKTGKDSTTRIISYIMTILIVLMTLSFIVMLFVQMIIPNEILIVYASLLTHQLTLLGINKKLENIKNKEEI